MALVRGFTLTAILLFAALGSSSAAPIPTVKPRLLIVGSPHFGNPAHDIANIHIEDVTSPKRQREIEAIVERLAAFHPTVVAVEWPLEKQAKLDQRYADYRAGRYKLAADEVDQLGLRLAALVGLKRVHAIDWLGEPPGKDSDYDFPAWAKANGRGLDWQHLQETSQARADGLSKFMACTPVSAWLWRLNTPAYRRSDQREYFEIATFGDAKTNPGANWVGAWYARNLRILDNLRQIAKPSDRVVIIYGAGHGFLLDQQARESGVFDLADTLEFLPPVPKDVGTHCR